MAIAIARLWLIPLPSSFWVDEMGTMFVVRHGAGDPSFTAAPQVPASIYYVLPGIMDRFFGASEIAYRLPSVLLMGIALIFIAQLAKRLIHPEAGWFAVFACLSLGGLDYEAADARPYALGICIAAASLLFLVRWFDTARAIDAGLFVIFAALLWRVQLIFWPFYIVVALYAAARLLGRDTRVLWWQALAAFSILTAALMPVALDALALFRQAGAHVIAPRPIIRELLRFLKYNLMLICGIGAWIAARVFGWKRDFLRPRPASVILIWSWWLVHPLALFGLSWITGNSIFVPRYLSLALPGIGLAATLFAAYSIPAHAWKPLAIVFAAGMLIWVGDWKDARPQHHNSNWRLAARMLNEVEISDDTPLICPSPFVEAKPPVWSPNYRLPGFLYANLPVYRVKGKPYPFPFEVSPTAEQWAAHLSKTVLCQSKQFAIYGGDHNVMLWTAWFSTQPEFSDWNYRRLGPFGDVDVVVFDAPVP